MKRHISIFALLLCAFAAVGPARAWGETTDLGALFISDKAVTVNVTGLGSGEFTTAKASGKSYYQGEYQWRDNNFTAQVPTGYRFDAWYTLENNDAEGSGTSPKLCTKRLETGVTISGSAIAANAKTTAAYFNDYVVCPKFIMTYKISTAVSPTGVGTVSVTGGNGDGTVDEGGSVTLTATPNKGYEFSKWSEGDVTENPRTISNIKADATYTAVFTKKVNSITSGPTIANWTYGDTPKAPSAQAQYTDSTGMTYTYYDSNKTSLGSQPPTNAGTYYIRATSPSSDEYDSATSDYVQFSISKKTINTDGVSFPNKSVTYTGGEQKIEASNVPSGVTVTYSNNSRTAVGEQTATAKFAPTDATNCEVTTASKTAKLMITAATITGVTLKSTSVTYDGQSHQPQVASVSANGKTFSSSDTGWTVVYQRDSVETSDFTTAGTITVKVTGTGNLTGSSSAYFTIGKKEIRMDEVVFADLTVTYDGTEKTIEASNVPSGVTATYSSNTRTTVGQQQARVTFEPNDKNHTVSLTQKLATLKIEQATITEVALNGTAATYDGQSHKPAIGWVTANNKTFSNSSTGWDVTYLRNGSATGDFTSPGTITVMATGNTNLKGSKSATFTINKATIESVTLTTVSATYDGKAHQPVVNSVTANSKGFSSASAGWTVAYTRGGAATTDFTSAGTITVTVTGKTALSGSASATFTIGKKTISTTGVGFSDKSVTYDGTAKSITASGVPEGVTVTYSNNSRTDAGSQTATVNFTPTDKENCTVSPTSKTATLTVNPATISSISLSATSATYDGQPHQPTVTSVTANGKPFTDAAIGWDVSYDKADFTSVGTIKVTATGKKNLTGSASGTFEIKSKSITVTFDPNGGTAPSPTSTTVQYPGTYGPLPTPTRKGYDFTGWWTAKEGGTEITSATSVESDASQTLFAHWEAKRYKLTVDANGGEYEGHKDSWDLLEPLIYGETNLNRIAVAIKNDDSLLLGYKIGSTMVFDAQGRCVKGALGEYWTADYPDGTYCHDGNLVVTAEWDDPREHYQVVVKASPEEAGTVSPAGTNTFVEGSNVVLTATAKAGYSFCCWSNDNKVVSTENPWTNKVTAAATYTAVFTGNVYTVTFVGMGGLPAVTNVDVKVGEKWGKYFPSLTYLIDGWKLTGWYSDPLCTEGNRIADDAFVEVPPSSLTPPSQLYAKWEKIATYIIAYDGNGATSGTMTNETALCGEETTLTSNKYERTGYAFVGWTNIVKQAFYADGATVKDLADADKTATLSAVWQANTYTVTFDGNRGKGNMKPQEFTYDEAQPLNSNEFNKPDGTSYSFVGWATSQSGSIAYTNKQEVLNLTTGTDITLYAKWGFDNELSIAADCAYECADGRQPVDLSADNAVSCKSVAVEGDPGKNGLAVRMMPVTGAPFSVEMSTTLTGPGVLKFHYKTSISNLGSELEVNLGNPGDPGSRLLCKTNVSNWAEHVIRVPDSNTYPVTWNFAVETKDADFALIDNIRWIPDGAGPEHPVPEKKNAVEIETAAFSDGKFKLEFESDAQFDYNLLTNANLLIDSWGKMGETKEGTGGTITFEPEIIKGQPQLFYKVETIQKK